MTIGDFLGQVRSGNGGEPVGRQVKGFADDFVHTLVGATLDALHQADDDGVIGNQSLEFDECHSRELRGDGHDYDVRVLDGFGAIPSGGHVVRQLFDGRQAHGVVVVIANALDNLLLLGPHGHRVACVRQHLAESSTPCSCTENRYIFTHIKFLPSLVAQLHRHNLVPCYSPRLPVREPVRLLLSRERAAGFRPRLATHAAVVPVAFSGELLATNFLQYCVHAFEHAPHQLVHGLGRRLFTP